MFGALLAQPSLGDLRVESGVWSPEVPDGVDGVGLTEPLAPKISPPDHVSAELSHISISAELSQ